MAKITFTFEDTEDGLITFTSTVEPDVVEGTDFELLTNAQKAGVTVIHFISTTVFNPKEEPVEPPVQQELELEPDGNA
jgi:hypothetical protein